ncbi:DUF1298 domain-containing protein [Hoyosella rhizosphaerae]|uniref:diacylglycerol O-acyltransferase n=1 Tax=Hoyosella rhizosphaerae TaxID=1755582 RepID=A0A916U2F3_9ACTN|nr:wax ester/triacylglycerol synthase domain-containing protein [Hoyosella rhizosphaerae]MBN4926691.1 DUF1298 domain-containing protein [Hoyosella rhizosphaerae]GGC57154.1 diacylglycerol O-acyltransferase [Hoyosella rhizosphaerae]
MRQLDPTSAIMLHLEGSGHHHNLMSVYFVDPLTSTSADELTALVEARLRNSPTYCARLQNVPAALGNPFWVRDPEFAVENHVSTGVVSGRGTWRDACDDITSIFDKPMDFSRPTWEVHIRHGVAPCERFPVGASIVIVKVHHVALDGLGLVQFSLRLFDTNPNTGLSPIAADTPATHTQPAGPLRVLGKVVASSPGKAAAFARDLTKTVRLNRKLVSAVAEGAIVPRPTKSARTVLNDTTSSLHNFTGIALPFADVARCRQLAPGATINDVALAVISGALRKFLVENDEIPTEDLICGVPKSLHGDAVEEGINKVTGLSVILHNTIADPVERLAAIRTSSGHEKRRAEKFSAAEIASMVIKLPPFMLKPIVTAEMKSTQSQSSTVNLSTVATNMPRGVKELYFQGERVRETYTLLPMNSGVGMKHEITSIGDTVFISVAADRDLLPDAESYADKLRLSFADLYSRTNADRSPVTAS